MLPGCCLRLMVCALSLKRLTFRKTCWDRSKCKCHAHWDQKALQKEFDMLPTCYLCLQVAGSIPQHLSTLSAICAWDHQWTLEQEWKYHAAVPVQMNRNPTTLEKHLKKIKIKAVQQKGSRECMLRSAFSTLLNISLFDLSMLFLYNLTTDLNSRTAVALVHTPSIQPFVVVRLTSSVPFKNFTCRTCKSLVKTFLFN